MDCSAEIAEKTKNLCALGDLCVSISFFSCLPRVWGQSFEPQMDTDELKKLKTQRPWGDHSRNQIGESRQTQAKHRRFSYLPCSCHFSFWLRLGSRQALCVFLCCRR